MKKIDSISLDSVPGFGKLLEAYLSSNSKSLPSSDFMDKISLEKRINSKSKFEHRDLLYKTLINQNKNIELSVTSKKNIGLIKEKNTVCVTTGHQLALVGGPLFVTYKILTAIKLAKEYSKLYENTNFVPVFWLASEDHDKDEINNFTIHSKEFKWETNQTGAVGDFNTNGILDLISQIESEVNGIDKTKLEIFKKAYSKSNLSEATRFLINELFGEFGIVIIDGNDIELKKLLIPTIEKEINQKIVSQHVSITNEKLITEGFEPAINPRELNLFLLTEGDRKRLEFSANGIKTVDDSQSWTIEEFIVFAKNNSEKISPNVLLRPIYQETILPNIAYVGGPAETEYWLQLDNLFLALGIEMPQRVLRICNTLISEKNLTKLNETGINLTSLFETEDIISKKIAKNLGGDNLDFTNEKKDLNTLFENLSVKAKHIDPTLEASVMAEKTRQEKALEGVFGKILKAEKTKSEVQINRVLKIRNGVLPNGKPQERSQTLLELDGIEFNEFFKTVLEDAEIGKMSVIQF